MSRLSWAFHFSTEHDRVRWAFSLDASRGFTSGDDWRTARLGLAAIGDIRPLPFGVLSRPTLSDLRSGALRGGNSPQYSDPPAAGGAR